MKKIVAMLLTLAMGLSLVACGNENVIDEAAAVRSYDPGDTTVYIDDEYTALVGSIGEAGQGGDATRTAELAQLANEVFNLVNAQRTAAGLPAYVRSSELDAAAYVRAKEIVSVFSHTRPNGTEYWTVNSQIVYGENLARGFSTANGVVDKWMNSESHRANILDSTLVTMGIAIYEQGGKLYWAQEFGY